jgi:hypothetical protein
VDILNTSEHACFRTDCALFVATKHPSSVLTLNKFSVANFSSLFTALMKLGFLVTQKTDEMTPARFAFNSFPARFFCPKKILIITHLS